MDEIWKDITGYEGLYQVSNLGNVRSLDKTVHAKSRNGNDFTQTYKGRILSQELINTNAYRVSLCKDGHVERFLTHRLVAQEFIPNPENKPEINHKNGNRAKDDIDNLEWCTHPENMHHAYNTGLQVPLFGENHQNCKISSEDIKFIRENYIPYNEEFGGKALAEKFNTHPRYIRRIVKMEIRKEDGK
jgi:hypothetical protein